MRQIRWSHWCTLLHNVNNKVMSSLKSRTDHACFHLTGFVWRTYNWPNLVGGLLYDTARRICGYTNRSTQHLSSRYWICGYTNRSTQHTSARALEQGMCDQQCTNKNCLISNTENIPTSPPCFWESYDRDYFPSVKLYTSSVRKMILRSHLTSWDGVRELSFYTQNSVFWHLPLIHRIFGQWRDIECPSP